MYRPGGKYIQTHKAEQYTTTMNALTQLLGKDLQYNIEWI
jgi:hypothetical protein